MRQAAVLPSDSNGKVIWKIPKASEWAELVHCSDWWTALPASTSLPHPIVLQGLERGRDRGLGVSGVLF